MRKMSSFLMMFGMLEFFQRTTRNDGRTRRLPSGHVIIPIMATLAAAMLHEEIWLCRTTFYAPPLSTPILRFKSTFWNGPTAEDMFSLRYRFRRADFADMLLRMHLASEVGGNLHFKYLRSSKRSLIPADFAMMVML